MWVRLPPSARFKPPNFLGGLNFMLGAGQLLGPRREAKGAAMYEFACACFTAPQGEYREPGLQENLVRDFTGRRRPPRNLILCSERANCLARVGRRKAGAMFLFERAPQGERERQKPRGPARRRFASAKRPQGTPAEKRSARVNEPTCGRRPMPSAN